MHCTLHYCYMYTYACATCIIFSAEAKHLRGVLRFLKKRNTVTNWRMIGIELQLTYSDLDIIERNRDSVKDCAAAMLNQWIISGRATKQGLFEALEEV